MTKVKVASLLAEWDSVIRRYAAAAKQRARSGCLVEADDLAQEVRLRLIRDLPRYDSCSMSLRGFILRRIHYAITDSLRESGLVRQKRHWRTTGARPIIKDNPPETVDSSDALDSIVCSRPDPLTVAEQVDTRIAILAGLKPTHAEAIRLYFFDDRDCAKVGEAIGLSQSGASLRIGAALSVLRRQAGAPSTTRLRDRRFRRYRPVAPAVPI